MSEYNIKDVAITRIATFDKRRDGTALVTQNDKPYKKVLIDVDSNCIDDLEFNGTLSMLDFDNVTENWTEGTRITGKIIHSVTEKGDFWNFELPKTDLRSEIAELRKTNADLVDENTELKRKLEVIRSGDSVDGSDSIEDLPF